MSIREIDDLPRMRLTQRQFIDLPEYSCTTPTFSKGWLDPHKFWKRHNGAHDLQWCARGGKPFWMIGQYVLCEDDPKYVQPKWFKPVIIIPAMIAREICGTCGVGDPSHCRMGSDVGCDHPEIEREMKAFGKFLGLGDAR